MPLMGHGLIMFRIQNDLTSAVRNLLEVRASQIQGSRKGVLLMVETCCKTLPVLMIPSILAVSTWLASRLQKNAAPAASGVERSKPKSISEMRQSKAPTLSKEHFALVKDSTRGHWFLMK